MAVTTDLNIVSENYLSMFNSTELNIIIILFYLNGIYDR